MDFLINQFSFLNKLRCVSLLGHLNGFFMRSLNPWPVFPSNLEAPVARSLSIQFILQALIEGFTQIADLETSDLLKGIHLKEEIKSISRKLEKFYLFSLENPLSQKGGVLDNLCFYSEILMKASQIKESDMVLVMEEMRKSILLFKSKMMVWEKMPASYSLNEMLEQLMQLYSSLLSHLCRFFSALTPFLKEARSDENVLIYLIENKKRLNQFLGPKCIEEMLQSFFPAGYDQLRAVIFEGYTRRGFSAFLGTVEPLIDEVQWEMPCQSQNPS